ncbi:MAG TPA: HlyD family type I secretion periplasmic adaptor subunit [Allosphingosinicella sp.]|uniref:HlyD family type I secretion periplasmic adaptor subunit n=1 Tax=Allosphingosinicella sp. TaxID=2823234 RepID=UPI002ED93AC3
MTDTALEDYVDRVRPATASNILLWIILGFVVLFFIWAALTELDRSVRGQGRVIPSSQLQVVSNLEGGIVEQILVRTGDMVRRGQPLVRLDPTASGSEFSSNQSQFNALRARIARLEGEVQGRPPAFPAATDPALAEQIAIERALHASRIADLNSLLAAAQARVAQAQRSVSEAQAAHAARQSAYRAAQTELNLIRPLVERGIEPRLSLVQAENQAAVAGSEAAAAAAAITRAQSQVAEAQASLAQQRQDWRSRAAQDLAAAQAEMVALRRSLPALSERVARTEVRSPLPGRVNRVLVTTVGGSVAPGGPLVEIVPSEESLLVEVQVRPADIAWVRLDQDAKINITAYDPSVYGALDGKVVTISPDATVNEKTGESFYTVRVATSDRLLDKAGRPLAIGPGMIADVSLLGDKRTVLDYIFSPITRLKDTALREQ